jgi:aconitase A
LPALEEKGLAKISRLPVSIRIVLASVLRNCDEKKVTVTLHITPKDGSAVDQTVKLRIDTPIEVDYHRHGGILKFVLRQLLS